ncbi:MAG: class I SAM-dependent methyltransferase [Anaerolineae bacterium]|jgi:predicted O-methyltransferase YrrM
MNPVLETILRNGKAISPSGEEFSVTGASISSEEGHFLRRIVCDIGAATTLEVGLAYGISALFICDGLAETGDERHIVIDPWQKEAYHDIGLTNLRAAGYGSLVEFHGAPSYQALPLLQADGCRVEFAFVDGCHTFDFALVDFFYIDRMLPVGGVVAFDDADWPGIRRLCEYVVTNRAYSVFRYLDNPQPAQSQTPQKKQFKPGAACRRLGSLLGVRQPAAGIVPGLPASSRCIALRKEAEDSRRWDFHRDF